MRITIAVLMWAAALACSAAQAPSTRARWTQEQAAQWYQQQPWLVGANYLPANAINQLEMWQTETFDPATIDKEFGWAAGIGMNTMRVFLHDLLWRQDAAAFQRRIEEFLTIAEKHRIRPMFVLFDSCWEALPKLGPQHPPIPGVHNSGWVQSPGKAALEDEAQYPRLEAYVKGVVGAFARDRRILAWDLWNEPADDKRVIALLPRVFEWARAAHPTQPLTAGVFQTGNWDKPTPVTSIVLAGSDVLSFHNYSWPEKFEAEVKWLASQGRPMICTEFMARSVGSTFDTILPIAKAQRVGAMNWGLVAGRSHTILPWDSWQRPYTQGEPTVWFHDVFKADGKPYRQREADIIRNLTGKR